MKNLIAKWLALNAIEVKDQNLYGRCIIKWFKHDSDASIDAKLQELLLDYGATGYGLYWYCIELIAQGVTENNITFELEHDVRIISKNLNLSLQETKDMMQKMIDLELFSLTQNTKIACYALAKRLDQSMTSNPEMRKIISSLKDENHDSIMIKSCKKRIEEKRREENRLDKKEFSFSLSKETSFDRLPQQYKDQLKAKIESENLGMSHDDFTESLQAKGYKYKNFWLAYRNWCKKDFNKHPPTNDRNNINKAFEGVEAGESKF